MGVQVGGSGWGADPDAELVERVLDGEREAFGELVRRHRTMLLRLGRAWLKDQDEAEDLAQEVFVKAFTKLGSFRGGARFSTWLFRIAYNTATTRRKQRRDETPFEAETWADASKGVEARVADQESAEELRAALQTLTADQALCVELCFFEELSYVEISRLTGLPVNTIKSHVFRAKRALRERLAPSMEVP